MSRARQLADLGNVTTRLDEVGNTDGALSNRNIAVNGGMTVSQRGTSGTTTGGNGLFICDRFYCNSTGASVLTYEKSTDAPDGFNSSAKVTVSTSQAIQSNDYSQFHTKIEGYDAARLGLGTANAKTFTYSFWVKSSVTGTFGIMFGNNGITMRYVTSYQINSANTWEYKTITIDGATSGSFGTTNDVGIYIYYDMGVGVNYSTSNPDQWGTGFTFGLTGGVKLKETSGATWQITGVQLEVGDQSTPFEHRSYGDELARCQRYYQVIEGNSAAYVAQTNNGNSRINGMWSTAMRASPSVTIDAGWVAPTNNTSLYQAYRLSGPHTFPNINADAEL